VSNGPDFDWSYPIDNKENHIYGILIGAGIQTGIDSRKYNHYSQLAFLQQEWCLGKLNRNDSISSAFSIDNSLSNGFCQRNHPRLENVISDYNGASRFGVSLALLIVSISIIII
jgi:hypothetical protein